MDAYKTIDENDFKIQEHRPCITHCNFMSNRSDRRYGETGCGCRFATGLAVYGW